MTPRPPSLYAALHVGSGASPDEVRQAYRRLAAQHHPDRQHAEADVDEAAMARINHAYAVLCDPGRRAQYDLTLRLGTQLAQPQRHRATVWLLWGLPPVLALAFGWLAWRTFLPRMGPGAEAATPSAASPLQADEPLRLVPTRSLGPRSRSEAASAVAKQ